MLQIVIFDDKAMAFGQAVCEQVPIPTTVVERGRNVDVCWHPMWNALGDVLAQKIGLKSVRLQALDTFRQALQWSRMFEGQAICFCDCDLRRVELNEEDVAHLGPDVLRALTGFIEAKRAAEILSEKWQGLVLAATLALNSRADTDIWISTSVNIGLRERIVALRSNAKGRSYIELPEDTLSSCGSADRSVYVVRTALEEYVRRRDFYEARYFWPEIARDWFAVGRDFAPAPHAHSSFRASEEHGHPDNLFHYLANLGATEDVARKWLAAQDCYEALKHLCGASAIAHNGNRRLTLGTLVFPLLLATKGQSWAADLHWNVGAYPIGPPDRGDSRELIEAALTLFSRLVEPRQLGGAPNSVAADFEKRSDGYHFLVDFGFDCSISDTQGKPSLSAKMLMLTASTGRPEGDVASAIWELLRLSQRSSGTLLLAIYPVSIAGRTWTRLDFRANQ
jgi:hypothetical protein